MAYGSVLTDVVQSSTAGTPPQFNDGNSTQIGTLCRAWVNYKGTATVSIRASFNVSSVTVNGTGDYTLNFTTALPDANYAVALTGTASAARIVALNDSAATPTASACRVISTTITSTAADSPYVLASVFR